MIRNETEYNEAVKRLGEEKARIKQQEHELGQLKLSRGEVTRAMDPIRSFHEQLREEVASYERLKAW